MALSSIISFSPPFVYGGLYLTLICLVHSTGLPVGFLPLLSTHRKDSLSSDVLKLDKSSTLEDDSVASWPIS